jgi:hypothetical protein
MSFNNACSVIRCTDRKMNGEIYCRSCFFKKIKEGKIKCQMMKN